MNNLELKVKKYVESKAAENQLKKECDELGTTIKKEFATLGINHFDTDTEVVTLVNQKRESMDEEKLIDVLKRNKLSKVIKKREYVDMDALESLIYSNEIPLSVISEMDNCRIVKTVKMLKVKKLKGE